MAPSYGNAAAAAAGAAGAGNRAISPQPPPPLARAHSHSNSLSRSETPSQSLSLAQQQHKRVYQACIPCRRRKVRCDLGSVDDPHDPPCVRCRRESKECFFSATRRKRKADDGVEVDEDDYTIRNGRKRMRASLSPEPTQHSRSEPDLYDEGGDDDDDVPRTPGGSYGRSQPLRRPDGPDRPVGRDGRRSMTYEGEGDANQTLENIEAQTVMRRGMYGPHDALDLLYKAATDRFVTSPRPSSFNADLLSPVAHHVRDERPSVVSSAPLAPPPTVPDNRKRDVPRPAMPREHHADPVPPGPGMNEQPGYVEAIKAWTRFRFVRAGWFTAQEAIQYIDYYYQYLSPMTPISPPTFSNPSSHLTLLTEEPILTVTLLTIASRYRAMPGPGGHCRSHAIHEQLWTYLRGMIERCLWGQEAFGGGFCGSVSPGYDDSQTSSTAPWRGMRKGSLRTLGTIEALMILTEWHPRALHFPPQEATDELLVPSYDSVPMFAAIEEEQNRNVGIGFGGKRIESWLEPAWRSDRMCWMLLSTAMGLAYELGVFDDIEDMLKQDAITRPEYQEEGYRLRASRIRRLVVIYTTQLAGRLGWTCMAPERFRKSDPAVAKRPRPNSHEGTTPGTNMSSMSNGFNYVPDLELDDQIIHCWAGISNAMHMGNEKLFRSRKHTTDIIQSGKYVELLREFGPLLRDWYREFDRFRLPQFIKHILTIEYEYVRIYVNSLSLQAVVERCTSHAGQAAVSGSAAAAAAAVSGPAGSGTASIQLSPQTMINYGRLPLSHFGRFSADDQQYIREVVNGSRNLLRTVVDGLLPGGFLKHAPVRTYFRIISGAMFLLKTFALGAPRSDVKASIELMDSTVEALRNCVVDDVHLGIRFADMLETLTGRLRNRFMHVASTMPGGSGKGQSPVPESGDINGHPQNHNGDMSWTGTHAQRLREGLNGNFRAGSPGIDANISATPLDLSSNFFYTGNTSIGPSTPAAALDPTAGGISGNIGAGNGGGSGDVNSMFDDLNMPPGSDMWYLPPGPAFFQNMGGGGDSSVAMTAEGVNVGGLDLLEYMAMDTPHFDGHSGGSGHF